jgi:hypothetical protein
MVRTIRLDVDDHPSEPPAPYGNSIGWWEDEVLVIDTVGFDPHPQGIAPRVPSGERKHLVERLELGPDGKRLTYSFELSDPEYLLATIGATVDWLFLPDAEINPVPCTLENARRFLVE